MAAVGSAAGLAREGAGRRLFVSVAIAGGKIYTLGNKGGRNNLVCLKAHDGSIVWTTPIGGGGGPNCTPTIDGDLVYRRQPGWRSGLLQNRTARWSGPRTYEKDFGGKMMSGWGYSESPLVDGDTADLHARRRQRR